MMETRSTAVRLAAPAQTFGQRWADGIRQVLRSATTVSDRGRQLCYDGQRGRGIAMVEGIANIASSCTDLADAMAPVDALRGHILSSWRSRNSFNVQEALKLEATADGAEDEAVVAYLLNPNAGTRARAIEQLRKQESATRLLIDSLHSEAGTTLRLM